MIKKIMAIQTEEGKLIFDELENFKTTSIDTIIYDNEITELVEIELDTTCHMNDIDDITSMNDLLEYYLENVKADSYIDYIKCKIDNKEISTRLAEYIQEEVNCRIYNLFDTVKVKFENLKEKGIEYEENIERYLSKQQLEIFLKLIEIEKIHIVFSEQNSNDIFVTNTYLKENKIDINDDNLYELLELSLI